MLENNIMNSENSWKYYQEHSNGILAEYIFEQADDAFLKKESYNWCDAKVERGPGIYYVSIKELGLRRTSGACYMRYEDIIAKRKI
jgi:hypothetical protein